MKIRALGAELFHADRRDVTLFAVMRTRLKTGKLGFDFPPKTIFFLPQSEHSDQLLRPSAVGTEGKAGRGLKLSGTALPSSVTVENYSCKFTCRIRLYGVLRSGLTLPLFMACCVQG